MPLLKRSQSGSRRAKGAEEWACEVTPLHDDKTVDLKFPRDISGKGVLDKVCEHFFNLEEKDYFGLQYAAADNQKKWLDLNNPAYKQLKHLSFPKLQFGVKHYPPHPTGTLKQNLSKYLLFCQLKKDLLAGRLYTSKTSDLVFLCGCIVQADFGDFDSFDGFEHRDYLCAVPLIPNQTPKMLGLIYDQHAELKGKSAQEAETLFLERAFTFDTYGIDPKPVRDRNGNSLFLGLSHRAVVTFHGSKLSHSFPWESISSIRVHDKMLLLEINLSSTKRHLLGFKCESKAAAASLWAASLEQQLFFTLNKGSEARVVKSNDGFLRRRRNSFRFSGRSQKELLSSSDYFLNLNQTAPEVVRQSRRAQVNQAEAQKKRDSNNAATRFATYPGRKRPEEADMDEQPDANMDQFQTLPPVLHGGATAAAAASAAESSAKSAESGKADDSKADSSVFASSSAAGSASVSDAAAASAAAAAAANTSASPAATDAVVDSIVVSEVVKEESVADEQEKVSECAAVEAAPEAPPEVDAPQGASNESEPSETGKEQADVCDEPPAATEDDAEIIDTVNLPVLVEAAQSASPAPTAEPELDDDIGSADTAVGQIDQVLEHHETVEAASADLAAAVVNGSSKVIGLDAAADGNPAKTVAPVPAKRNKERPKPAPISPVSKTQAALFLAAAFSLLTLAGVVLFFEAELSSSAMLGLRQHPLVHEFYDRIYGPIRGRLV